MAEDRFALKAKDGPVMVSCRAREIRAGLVAEVFYAPAGWVLRTVTKAEKRPGKRANAARHEPGTPTRYLVWYEGIPGHRTLTPGTSIAVTAQSWYALQEQS